MVILIKNVNADVAIFPSASVTLAVRMEANTVDGAEVTFDVAELLLEHQVEEPGVELADLGAGHGDVHGLLAAAQHHVVVHGRDGGAVHRSLGLISVQAIQGLRVPQFGRRVLRRRDEHGL